MKYTQLSSPQSAKFYNADLMTIEHYFWFFSNLTLINTEIRPLVLT